MTHIPTIFHITHWKSGSQWIHRILLDCVPAEQIVRPEVGEGQFLQRPLLPGKIYPTVYVTREQFESVILPEQWRRFIIIRDLRDTLVSAYFSIKFSHPTVDPKLTIWRNVLHQLSEEDGFIYLMDEWLVDSVRIQQSWLQSGEKVYRYEDLLENDLGILSEILLDHCCLPMSRAEFSEIVKRNRFENLTGGRPRGIENIMAHERKGVAGDWSNHFSSRVKSAFKDRYNDLLLSTGYVQTDNW